VAVCACRGLAGHRPGVAQPIDRLARCVPRRLGRFVDTVITVGLVAALLGATIGPATTARAAVSLAMVSHQAPRGGPLEWPGLPDRHPAAPPKTRRHQGSHHTAARIGLVSAAPHRDPGDGQLVTVQAGDSLWSLAAARLGPAATAGQIAAAWPGWYAANRHVIGDDPSLIFPGQRLRPPPQRPAGSSS
jgi:resuscitation-promoting factor RpfA